jgi:two-component system nitrogen regulation sensor histidine kinase NtrY
MLKTISERKRLLEIVAILMTTLGLVGLSRLETRLFELAENLAKNRDFFTTVVYFGLINFNVILILLLSFLLFRNVAKGVVERRRGVFGSNIRFKLVATLMFFALAPTLLFFYVSARFIVSSFDEWFSDKVRITMHQTREAGARIYKQDQVRLESLSRLALQKIKVITPQIIDGNDIPMILTTGLKGFEKLYGLDEVKVFDKRGQLLWSSRVPVDERSVVSDPFVVSAVERFSKDSGLWALSTVAGSDQLDIVRGIAPIMNQDDQQIIGAVVTETQFETQILKSIESIQQSFSDLKQGAQLIKLSYLILLVVMSLLVAFSAVWLGFYVARGITGPIQSLAEGTREVALGNYSIKLTSRTQDELGQLVNAFNLMTQDLGRHRRDVENARLELVATNHELESRRRHMEIILQNIAAGVLVVDRYDMITNLNPAAAKILAIDEKRAVGKGIQEVFSQSLIDDFWEPIHLGLSGGRDRYRAQIEATSKGKTLTLIVNANRIYDRDGRELGAILLIDDASEQVKLQKVAAWREVARRIAHEIKNPVTPIKLSAQRLLRRYHERFMGEDQEVFESCLETILKQVDSLRDLVNEFSKFARLPEAQLKIGNVNNIISDVIDLYRMSYPQIEFDTSGLGPVPDILIDADQMNRAIVNLVTNAVEAFEVGEQSGKVEVATKLIENLGILKIEIRDYGRGIPQALRDRVLEPYFSTKDTGTGLGLAIVNQIIADHGGYLRILPHEPTGTTVVIELPLKGSITRIT